MPFASKVRTTWNGESVGVMHACGHDAHVAILMSVASVLAGLRDRLAGSVKFIFQPAEEMPPAGEEGGARLMIDEGALAEPGARRDLRPARHLAARDRRRSATARGRRWRAPTASGSRSPAGRRTARCRGAASIRSSPPRRSCSACRRSSAARVDIAREPVVVTVGAIKGGVRENIIPDSVELRGTIRTFDEAMRDDVHARVQRHRRAHLARVARRLRGLHHQELSGHRQRRRAHRGDAAHARARRRQGAGRR